MEAHKDDATERLIDATLRAEPFRAVSQGFGRSVRRRLAIVALIEQERQRFRTFLAAGGIFLVGIFSVAIFVFTFADLPGILMRTIPGVMGYYDYVAASLILFGGGVAGLFALLFIFSLGVTALLTLRLGYK